MARRPPGARRLRAATLIATALFWTACLQTETSPEALERSPTLNDTATSAEARVSASSDDAEERDGGRVKTTSSDLEMVFDRSQQIIGIRFPGVQVPPGATITGATVQFQTDETTSEPTDLTIHGEASDDAATFAGTFSVSSRPRTSTSANWSPPPWTNRGEAGPAQRTEDLSAVIQEIVDRPGWQSGNALVLIVSGSGRRVAESYDGDAAGAPLLQVTFDTCTSPCEPPPPPPPPPPPSNTAPQVDAGPDQTITLSQQATLNGSATDDGLPNDTLSVSWSVTGGDPTAVTFADAASPVTSATFGQTGVYTLRLTADDGELSEWAETTVTVDPDGGTGGTPGGDSVEVRVSASSDDVEQDVGGGITLGSSDLEMTQESSQQLIGIRFVGVQVPYGATITGATVQFQTDETTSEPTDLIIHGEATDDAVTFGGSNDVSSRATTVASVAWSPPPWTNRGEAGPAQRSEDISEVIQEIVDRPGWQSGNALVLIVSGTGKRVAESYDGDAAGAPLLQVTFDACTSPCEPPPPPPPPPPSNTAPQVDAGPDRTVTVNGSIVLNGSATDDGLPNDTLSVSWSVVAGDPTAVSFADAASAVTGATFSQTGTFTLQLAADDGELSAADTTTVTVDPPGSSTAVVFGAGGDFGGRDDRAGTVMTDMLGRDLAAFLLLGDVSYSEKSPEQAWCDWVHSYLGPAYPMQLVAGNHERDFGSDGFILNFTACMPDRLNSELGPGGYGVNYAFDLGPVTVVGISPDLTIAGVRYDFDPGTPERSWLVDTIRAARAEGDWVVVGMHKVCVTIGNKWCQLGEGLPQLLIAEGVDLTLHGHDHDYQRSHSLALVVVGSVPPGAIADDGADGEYARGVGTVSVIAGAVGKGLTTCSHTDPEFGYFAAHYCGEEEVQSTVGYLIIQADAAELTVQFLTTKGDPFGDTFTIR